MKIKNYYNRKNTSTEKYGGKKFEFSKIILIFETVIVAILTIRVLNLIELSINNLFDGSFPYLTTMVSVAWAAYGTSVSFYYNKSKLENKIKLIQAGADKDVVMQEPYIKAPKTKRYHDCSADYDDYDDDYYDDDEALG